METTENHETTEQNEPTAETVEQPTPKTALWQKIWAWLDLIEIEKKVAAITSITVKLAIFCTVVAGGIVIYAELTSESYMIEPFQVPEDLAKNGFTGIALANQMNDQIQEIQKLAYFTDPNMQIFAQTNEGSSFEVQMVGFALPIQSLINYVGKITGIDKRRKIAGELFLSEKTLYLHLRGVNTKTDILEQKMDSLPTKKAVDLLLQQATQLILKQYNPIVLANHLSENGKPDQAIPISKYILYNQPENRKWALMLWGTALNRQKKYEEAIQKYQEALQIDSIFVPAFYYLGTALNRQKKYEEAIEKRKKAIELNPDYTPSYNGIGFTYYLMKRYDSAAYWVQEGLKRNSKNGYAYSTLAEIYEAKGDLEKFYDYLELACENGYPLWAALEYETWAKYVNEPRFQTLVEKYRIE